ncbi:MAG: class I SAM-dependent methyltransferase [Bacteroidia bacterium]
MNIQETKQEWFENWFDSAYYHMLYKNRDEREAEEAVKNIVRLLNLPEGSTVLDLACGKGRHALALNRLGYRVTGLDLSENSIGQALKFQNEHLEFYVHDMRKPFRIHYYDAVLNLFTSFGYFKNVKENIEVIRSVHSGLKPHGKFVIDYFCKKHVETSVEACCTGSSMEGPVRFEWTKKIENGFVFKNIHVSDGDRHYDFQERVQLFGLQDFREMLAPYFKIIDVKGNYNMEAFSAESSPRMIIIAERV